MPTQDFKLTPHFSFYELTQTSNAGLQELNRQRALEIKDKLHELATLMEVVRGELGHSVEVHSGFRCPELNASTIGSSSKSQHMLGEAMDFSGPGTEDEAAIEKLFQRVLGVVKGKRLPFGQLIRESAARDYGRVHWIHLSLGSPFRELAKCGQVMTMVDGKYNLLESVETPT